MILKVKHTKLLLMFIIALIINHHATSQIINTISGNGNNVYAGDGGLAINASLNSPRGICVDYSGNVYIADWQNHSLRKINASTGIITTIAGNGTIGFSGDGGLAVNSTLDYPTGVFVDSTGNIYVTVNQRIRKISASTGIINTIAGNGLQGNAGDGGAAINAQLNNPACIFIDRIGNIYLADSYNNKIRKIDAVTGIINTIAGNGFQSYSGDGGLAINAALYYPFGICADTFGNVYFADQYNHRIRMINASTGIITTIAGNNTGGYSGDGGAATNASLHYPNGLYLDGSNNLYIGDLSNLRIRKVNISTGIITTIGGNGTYGFSGDGGIATNAQFMGPTGIYLDRFGNVYASDQMNNRIRKITTKPTGTNERTIFSEKLNIYPNPSNGKFIISIENASQICHIELYDFLGAKIFEQKILQSKYETNYEIDLSEAPSGIYFSKIFDGTNIYSNKIIIE